MATTAIAGESYGGHPHPPGWTRVRSGTIEAGDLAAGDGSGAGGSWVELPARYVGAKVGFLCCVIRRMKEATAKATTPAKQKANPIDDSKPQPSLFDEAK